MRRLLTPQVGRVILVGVPALRVNFRKIVAVKKNILGNGLPIA
jgi:hypothetical protein